MERFFFRSVAMSFTIIFFLFFSSVFFSFNSFFFSFFRAKTQTKSIGCNRSECRDIPCTAIFEGAKAVPRSGTLE